MASRRSARELRFLDEYLIDMNATAAARRAGYSTKTASQIGYQLLHKTSVQRELAARVAARAARLELNADTVLGELLKIATVDIRKAFGADGALKPLDEIPDEVAAALAGVEILEEFAGTGENREQIGFTKKVRFLNKIEALNLLGKHLRLFAEKLELDDPQNLVARMWEARRRVGQKPS